MAHGQGIGRHTEAEVMEIGLKDLRTLSLTLVRILWICYLAVSKYRRLSLKIGTKPYFMGDKPTEMDCSLFGMLSMVVWAMPDSSYEQLVNGKLSRSS